MRLPPAVCATVLRATTAALMALLRLLVPAAAAPAASTTLVKATLTAIPVPVGSIKTRVRRQVARLAQG